LVFPVPASVGRDAFVEHVRDVVSRMPPFDIHLKGLEVLEADRRAATTNDAGTTAREHQGSWAPRALS
jgi:hypothetical protein